MMDSQEFLIITKSSNKEFVFKLGKIDGAYSSGRPEIVFDGETQATAKKYPYLKSYTPTAQDRVLLAKVAGSYIVLGKIV